MPMSERAYEGLMTAVRHNPYMAKEFLGILREHPGWVMYKPEDQYGPLGLMFAALPRKHLSPGVTVPVTAEPLSETELSACRAWNEEWLRRDFSKQELAEAIATILRNLPKPPPGEDANLVGTSEREIVLYDARRR